MEKKEHEERFAICFLLSTLAINHELKYPLQLVHQDRPDFKLISEDVITGIEVTFSKNRNQAHFRALINRSNEQKIYSTNVFGPDENLSGEEIKSLSKNEISGFPLMGDEPYRNWASYVSKSVLKKSKDYVKDKFEKFIKNTLCIVVETPDMICISDINKAIRYLDEAWPAENKFDCVYVQHYNLIIKIVPKKLATIYVVNDVWSFFKQL